MIALGTPNLENMFFFKNLITTLLSLVCKATASTHVDTTFYYVTGTNGAWRVVRNNDIGIVPIA